VASRNNLSADHVSAPELRALLEQFVSTSANVAYATLLNTEAKGISAGRVDPNPSLQEELQHAFSAAREHSAYTRVAPSNSSP
jgi:hypothetical protein